jgi:hypothetical protein
VKKRNYAIGAGFLLGLFAVISYFTLVTEYLGPRQPFFRDVPVLNLALLALALGLSLVGLGRAFSRTSPYRGRILGSIFGVLNFAFAGLFCWYLFSFSYQLPAAANAPKVGVEAPDFTLPDSTQRPVHLASLRGHNVLLVFYRGHW